SGLLAEKIPKQYQITRVICNCPDNKQLAAISRTLFTIGIKLASSPEVRNQMVESNTDSRHPAADGLHLQPAGQILSALLDAQIGALAGVKPALPAIGKAAELGAAALARGGRMGYAGAGSSGLMALADSLELAGTFGLPPERTP